MFKDTMIKQLYKYNLSDICTEKLLGCRKIHQSLLENHSNILGTINSGFDLESRTEKESNARMLQ
jgi:hypothetical protein